MRRKFIAGLLWFFGAGCFCLGTSGSAVAASDGDAPKKGFEESLSRLKESLDATQKRIRDLEERQAQTRGKLENAERMQDERTSQRTDLIKVLKRAENQLKESKRSEEDFSNGLQKDREQLEYLEKDIEVTKKRLIRLEEDKEIISSHVENDEENLSKLLEARSVWERNLESQQTALKETDGFLRDLDVQKKLLKSGLERDEDEMKKWQKQLEVLQGDLNRFEKR